MLFLVLLLIPLGCASSRAPDLVDKGPPPDWITSGGKSPRYPVERYLTGFAMVPASGDESALASAREQASADLSRKISVRIQHSLRDVSESRDGEDSYYLASIINASGDIKLSGLDYEAFSTHTSVYAFVHLERGAALLHRRFLRTGAIEEMRACLASAERHEKAGRGGDAIDTYESCRSAVASALDHDAVARALAARAPQDAAAQREIASASRFIDEKIRAIMGRPASSMREAVERLAIQLRRQKGVRGGHLTVAPFTYGTTDLSSAFGREASIELERALARGAADIEAGDARVVRGVYLERGEEIRLTVTVRDTLSGRLVASAESSVAHASLPQNVSLKPANFEEALRDQRILAAGELIVGDLAVEVWTDRGRRGVVYSERDEMTLYYRVNQPAWLRFVYVLQSGEQVPMGVAVFVGAERVNRVITYPEIFEIVPPFGVEHIHAMAFERQPDPIVTVDRMIDGVEYTVVRGGMNDLVKTRGIQARRKQTMAEAFVTVTTTPR